MRGLGEQTRRLADKFARKRIQRFCNSCASFHFRRKRTEPSERAAIPFLEMYTLTRITAENFEKIDRKDETHNALGQLELSLRRTLRVGLYLTRAQQLLRWATVWPQ